MIYELRRAFKTPEFKVAFIMGMLIISAHIILSKVPEALSMLSYMDKNFEMKYPESSYIAWICVDNRFYMYMYLLILPVLAALPYSSSLYSDLKGSIAANVITRNGKFNYLKNKFIAVFVSGGIISCVPLIIDMVLCFMLFPAVDIEPASKAVLMPKASFSMLYYKYPLAYFGICLIMIFIYSGVMSVFCLTTTFYVKHRYSIIISGFIVSLFIISLCELLGVNEWQPTSFLAGYYYSKPRLFPYIVETIIIFFISFFNYMIIGMRGDLQ